MPEITVSNATFERLQRIATPIVDTGEDVVCRLLDAYEDKNRASETSIPVYPIPTTSILSASRVRPGRSRGIDVEIETSHLAADSVKDLYGKALKWLLENGYEDRLRSALPVKTSAVRYLIAESPIHPTGKGFVVPLSQAGFHMETHKDYRNAVSHLSRLMRFLGVRFRAI